MSKAGSRCAFVVVTLLGVTSASAPSPWRHQGFAGALDDATVAKLGQSRAQRRSEGDRTTETTRVHAAHAPAGERVPVVADSKVTVASGTGAGMKRPMPASLGESVSASVKGARAAAGELEGKAGIDYISANDVTNAFSNGSGRRKLQESCPEGSGVTVTSSEFPLLEGCLQESEGARFLNSHVEFSSDTGLIVSGLSATDSTTEYWFAVYFAESTETTTDGVVACQSVEPASSVHPSEASWFCNFDGAAALATATTFSIECGCDGVADDDGSVPGSPPTTSASPAETTSASTPHSASTTSATPATSASGGCAADESLGVTSTAFPEIEGCLEETVLSAGGELEYLSTTGVIYAAAIDETAPNLEVWVAFYGDTSVPQELVGACFSEQFASYVHPSEATWICADAAGNTYLATGTDFIVTCGCDGVVSPTPTTITSSAATATPMGRGLDLTPAPAGSSTSSVAPGQTLAPAAASPNPTSQPSSSPGAVANPGACVEASITVTSSEFPLLEGCFLEADLEVPSLEGGESEYVGGQAGLIYAGGVQGEEDYIWFAVYLNGTTSDAEPVFACFSDEPASMVHPAEATWICDFGTEIAPPDPAAFSVECGCDGVVDDGGAGGGGDTMSPTPTTATSSGNTPAPTVTDRGFDGISDITPAPADVGGDDDTSAAEIPTEGDADDDEGGSAGIIGATDGTVGRSLSAWSAAAGAGATGVIAAVMTLAMGRW